MIYVVFGEAWEFRMATMDLDKAKSLRKGRRIELWESEHFLDEWSREDELSEWYFFDEHQGFYDPLAEEMPEEGLRDEDKQ